MLKVKSKSVRQDEATIKLFNQVVLFADELENIIENGANYHPKFLQELSVSMKQANSGKVQKLKSISVL